MLVLQDSPPPNHQRLSLLAPKFSTPYVGKDLWYQPHDVIWFSHYLCGLNHHYRREIPQERKRERSSQQIRSVPWTSVSSRQVAAEPQAHRAGVGRWGGLAAAALALPWRAARSRKAGFWSSCSGHLVWHTLTPCNRNCRRLGVQVSRTESHERVLGQSRSWWFLMVGILSSSLSP